MVSSEPTMSAAASTTNAVSGSNSGSGGSNKPHPIDAKREEFRKYLEKEGILESLTRSLVSLYEEPEKPSNALSYLKNNFAGHHALETELKSLRTENDKLKEKVSTLEKEKFLVEEQLTAANAKVAASATATPAAEEEEESPKKQEKEEMMEAAVDEKSKKEEEVEAMDTEEAPKPTEKEEAPVAAAAATEKTEDKAEEPSKAPSSPSSPVKSLKPAEPTPIPKKSEDPAPVALETTEEKTESVVSPAGVDPAAEQAKEDAPPAAAAAEAEPVKEKEEEKTTPTAV